MNTIWIKDTLTNEVHVSKSGRPETICKKDLDSFEHSHLGRAPYENEAVCKVCTTR